MQQFWNDLEVVAHLRERGIKNPTHSDVGKYLRDRFQERYLESLEELRSFTPDPHDVNLILMHVRIWAKAWGATPLSSPDELAMRIAEVEPSLGVSQDKIAAILRDEKSRKLLHTRAETSLFPVANGYRLVTRALPNTVELMRERLAQHWPQDRCHWCLLREHPTYLQGQVSIDNMPTGRVFHHPWCEESWNFMKFIAEFNEPIGGELVTDELL